MLVSHDTQERVRQAMAKLTRLVMCRVEPRHTWIKAEILENCKRLRHLTLATNANISNTWLARLVVQNRHTMRRYADDRSDDRHLNRKMIRMALGMCSQMEYAESKTFDSFGDPIHVLEAWPNLKKIDLCETPMTANEDDAPLLRHLQIAVQFQHLETLILYHLAPQTTRFLFDQWPVSVIHLETRLADGQQDDAIAACMATMSAVVAVNGGKLKRLREWNLSFGKAKRIDIQDSNEWVLPELVEFCLATHAECVTEGFPVIRAPKLKLLNWQSNAQSFWHTACLAPGLVHLSQRAHIGEPKAVITDEKTSAVPWRHLQTFDVDWNVSFDIVDAVVRQNPDMADVCIRLIDGDPGRLRDWCRRMPRLNSLRVLTDSDTQRQQDSGSSSAASSEGGLNMPNLRELSFTCAACDSTWLRDLNCPNLTELRLVRNGTTLVSELHEFLLRSPNLVELKLDHASETTLAAPASKLPVHILSMYDSSFSGPTILSWLEACDQVRELHIHPDHNISFFVLAMVPLHRLRVLTIHGRRVCLPTSTNLVEYIRNWPSLEHLIIESPTNRWKHLMDSINLMDEDHGKTLTIKFGKEQEKIAIRRVSQSR